MSAKQISALINIRGSFPVNIYLIFFPPSNLNFYRALTCGSHCLSSHTLFCHSLRCNKARLARHCLMKNMQQRSFFGVLCVSRTSQLPARIFLFLWALFSQIHKPFLHSNSYSRHKKSTVCQDFFFFFEKSLQIRLIMKRKCIEGQQILPFMWTYLQYLNEYK